VLQADMGSNPSYAWRSLHNSIWIIKKGNNWRIGSGEKVKIWESNWIPAYNNFNFLTPVGTNPNINLVKDLIRQEDSSWNEEIIAGSFLPL